MDKPWAGRKLPLRLYTKTFAEFAELVGLHEDTVIKFHYNPDSISYENALKCWKVFAALEWKFYNDWMLGGCNGPERAHNR